MREKTNITTKIRVRRSPVYIQYFWRNESKPEPIHPTSLAPRGSRDMATNNQTTKQPNANLSEWMEDAFTNTTNLHLTIINSTKQLCSPNFFTSDECFQNGAKQDEFFRTAQYAVRDPDTALQSARFLLHVFRVAALF